MTKVSIITANKLAKKHVDALKKAVEKKYGKQVEYDFKIDSAVIGGIKVVVGSKAVDMTVAGKLASVKKQMLAQL